MNNQSESHYYKFNRERFLDCLPESCTAVFFAATPKVRSSDTLYPYCQDKNFYYLTGVDIPGTA